MECHITPDWFLIYKIDNDELILTALRTGTHLDTLHAGGLFTVLKKCGDIVTSEGINTNKGYIDIVDSKDWIVSNIVYQTQKLLNNELKVPYTNIGIGMLEKRRWITRLLN